MAAITEELKMTTGGVRLMSSQGWWWRWVIGAR
jgi:hypothetical protein